MMTLILSGYLFVCSPPQTMHPATRRISASGWLMIDRPEWRRYGVSTLRCGPEV